MRGSILTRYIVTPIDAVRLVMVSPEREIEAIDSGVRMLNWGLVSCVLPVAIVVLEV